MLSADDVQLNNNSDIKGEIVNFGTEVTSNEDKKLKITSQTGSKVTSPKINFKGKALISKVTLDVKITQRTMTMNTKS